MRDTEGDEHEIFCGARAYSDRNGERCAVITLQAQFIQAQMQAMTEQAKDLSETATKALMDAAKTPTTGGLSS